MGLKHERAKIKRAAKKLQHVRTYENALALQKVQRRYEEKRRETIRAVT